MGIEKTGGFVWLKEYEVAYRADIYTVNGVIVARINGTKAFFEKKDMDGPVWATITKIGEWFDRTEQHQTIIAERGALHFKWNATLERFIEVDVEFY